MFSGNHILIKINNTLIAGELSSSANYEMGLSSVVINGGKFEEYLPERLKMSVGAEILYDAATFETLWNAYINKQLVNVKFGGVNAGDKYVEGNGYIALSHSSPKNAPSTISVTITISGEFTLKTV